MEQQSIKIEKRLFYIRILTDGLQYNCTSPGQLPSLCPLPDLEQLAPLQRDPKLHQVQSIARCNAPSTPDVGSFPHCAIAAAGHVSEDAVKAEGLLLWGEWSKGLLHGSEFPLRNYIALTLIPDVEIRPML